jgi:hypothetical protein
MARDFFFASPEALVPTKSPVQLAFGLLFLDVKAVGQ